MNVVGHMSVTFLLMCQSDSDVVDRSEQTWGEVSTMGHTSALSIGVVANQSSGL